MGFGHFEIYIYREWAECTTPRVVHYYLFVIYNYFLYSDDSSPATPVYEIPPPKYSADSILKILLDPEIDQDKICKEKPFNVTESATYVVNIKNLQHPDDIKKDQFGIWNYSGSHPKPIGCITKKVDTYLWRSVEMVQLERA